MTDEETMNMLKIMAMADHECTSCVRDLFRRFLNLYPEKSSLVKIYWDGKFGEDDTEWEKKYEIDEFGSEPL